MSSRHLDTERMTTSAPIMHMIARRNVGVSYPTVWSVFDAQALELLPPDFRVLSDEVDNLVFFLCTVEIF